MKKNDEIVINLSVQFSRKDNCTWQCAFPKIFGVFGIVFHPANYAAERVGQK